ncbi:hypothetical protein D3C87_1911160 [compost metagenome]
MENQPQHHRRHHPKQDVNQRQTAFALAFVLRLTTKVNADQTKQATPEHHNDGQNGA